MSTIPATATTNAITAAADGTASETATITATTSETGSTATTTTTAIAAATTATDYTASKSYTITISNYPNNLGNGQRNVWRRRPNMRANLTQATMTSKNTKARSTLDCLTRCLKTLQDLCKSVNYFDELGTCEFAQIDANNGPITALEEYERWSWWYLDAVFTSNT
ncbi:hypothetical protein HELRODRAFT_179959 [Helobdella robusta]|uniref:Apple domain-containing protein n=1 Tax=Helobdella robusta TaxID=6412 RepID=T1FFA4_HELRO|nr:hypothetical protein HELRODRAFT_179959 [Helobdella robusta]ESN94861.1 hypothetical protein HELRODRAFT_179959 [Helobdella robusta]